MPHLLVLLALPLKKKTPLPPAVFGNYIDVYDISQAVEDGATVRIYYESRLARIQLKEKEKERLDLAVEEITENEESTATEKAKAKWAQLRGHCRPQRPLKNPRRGYCKTL